MNNMTKRLIRILFTVTIALLLAVSGVQGATNQANPTNSSVFIDESKVAFEAYNISNNNYIKLRDLAMALNGSGKSFDVTWDAAKNAINLLTNRAYMPVGGELSVSINSSAKTASLTTSKIYIDGKETSFDEAGSFDYICKFHNGMGGKVIVE